MYDILHTDNSYQALRNSNMLKIHIMSSWVIFVAVIVVF